MPRLARLVTTLAAPLPFSGADAAPHLESRSASRLLVQRGDTELIVQEVQPPATASTVSFPAPWPRRFGTSAVSPAADLVVFAGPHALRAVDQSGSPRWELRHRCWAGCPGHTDFSEYADDRDHRYANRGSAGFSSDGKTVWAHVPGPLEHDTPDHDRGEEWLVIDAADGAVLARTQTRTAAAGSVHVPHPDPAQMGLSIGEGQDGSPLRWGKWDGHALIVHSFGDEDRVLLGVSPSGDRLGTVTHDQDVLAVHLVADGSVVAELNADVLPPHPAVEEEAPDDEAQAFFDYEGGFVDESTLVLGTVESDEEFGTGRHWLVDAVQMRLIDRITYPFEVPGLPKALGDGTWYTVSNRDRALHIWAL